MASIAVLPPHDCIKHHLPRHGPLIPPKTNPNPNSTRSNRRKRSPEKKNSHLHNNNKPRNATMSSHDLPPKTLLMGQVKILKRGEEEMAPPRKKNPAHEKKPGGLGETKAKQTRTGDFYAGAAVMITSPPPSSLPLPVFFTKKSVLRVDSDASADLRRLLRLDLM